jgi:RND superfamily putative drug exporter
MKTASDRVRGFTVRHRWAIVIAAIGFVVLAGLFGGDVQSHLKSGGFEASNAESARAAAILENQFRAGDPDVVLLVTAQSGGVDDPRVAAAARALGDKLAVEPGVAQVTGYWQLGSPPALRSAGADKAMMFARLSGSQDERLTTAGRIRDAYQAGGAVITVGVGGEATAFDQVNKVIETDTATARKLAFPATALLLVLIFGSLVAGLLPVVIGAISVVGTFFVLSALGSLTDVSVFALSFTTAMGLGLSIDYSLLIVSRFREELAAGHAVPDAVRRTVRTAGRTVVFSAATVASSLVALLVFEQYFLRSFAYAGIAAVGLAALAAVTVLPAVLALLGHRVNRLRIVRRRPSVAGNGRWHRLAGAVMRRPVPVAAAVIALLVVLGLPFLGVKLGFPDDRMLPAGTSSRDVGEVLRTEFDGAESAPLVAVAPGIGDPSAHAVEIEAYAARLSTLDGVARVDAFTGSYVDGTRAQRGTEQSRRFASGDATYLSVIPSGEPISEAGEKLTADVRAVPAPFETLVGGPAAELVDGKAGLADRLPLALLIIAVVTFLVLLLAFGSLVLPLTAILLNLLSLTATFGALVWIFQDGHLAGVLGFTPTGSLLITMPILIFVVAFGLSMDYEVFMLSRVKEEYDRTGDNTRAVVRGLERTGRIVTAAAVLIAVVFAAFATGQVSSTKMFGVGMALAVLVDAFVIRTLLVPAVMRLLGRANWWAPRPLRRLHQRFGFTESVEPAHPEVPERQPAAVGR